MPRKKKIEMDYKIQQKLDYLGLDLTNIPKVLKEYTNISFKVLKGYDEKVFKEYSFVNIKDIEILLSPTNRTNSIKEKYEKAVPLINYLDGQTEENLLNYTKFLEMLTKVKISSIQEIEEEQKNLSKVLPFRVKYEGNYLWQIYYSENSNKYFMIVTTEDSDYSAFFYLLKKKIENKSDEKIFVPINYTDYSGEVLTSSEIKDIEQYLWLFTKDYPSIYEIYDKKNEPSIQIIGETKIYENITTLYRVILKNKKEASKFYKLLKALFIMQTELPHYFEFNTQISKDGSLEFYFENSQMKYEILPEFVYEQYLKSISLRNKVDQNIEVLKEKLENLQIEEKNLTQIFGQKEKQITTYLECKKTFFGKVKYFFKYSGKQNKKKNEITQEIQENEKSKSTENKKEKFKLEERNYTLSELDESYKELNQKEEVARNLALDINALKLKNKNLKKKIENATNYLEEINKHKKSIFEFWKYANKDEVAALEEGEEEEINIKNIEKVFSFKDDFEKFGINSDKFQRNKLTDDEMDSIFVCGTNILELVNKTYLKTIENKEISEELKRLKIKQQTEENEEEEEEIFNIFGKIKEFSKKERTIGNKTHRETPRDLYEILEIAKGTKGIELKKKIEIVLKNLLSALNKNQILEDMYVYIASLEKLELNKIEKVSLNVEGELENFLNKNETINKFYLYKIKLPKGTNYVAFSNIIYYDNKNMTLPVGMNLSENILIDFSKLEFNEKIVKKINKLKFEDEKDDFSKIIVKQINVEELK